MISVKAVVDSVGIEYAGCGTHQMELTLELGAEELRHLYEEIGLKLIEESA